MSNDFYDMLMDNNQVMYWYNTDSACYVGDWIGVLQ